MLRVDRLEAKKKKKKGPAFAKQTKTMFVDVKADYTSLSQSTQK